MCGPSDQFGSSDGSVTSGNHASTRPPVRNTFIHFDVPRACGGRRVLQRNKTDPATGPAYICEEFIDCTGGTDSSSPSSCDEFSEQLTTDCDKENSAPEQTRTTRCGAEAVERLQETALPLQPIAPQPGWTTLGLQMPQWTPESPRELRPKRRVPASSPSETCRASAPIDMPVLGLKFVQGGLGVLFNFTLRLAPGFGFGLDLMRAPDGRTLIVQGVLAQGAIEAWNRQALSGSTSGKAVVPGDRLVRVNDSVDCDGMLNECNASTCAPLKLFFARGSVDVIEPTQSPESAQRDPLTGCNAWSAKVASPLV